jgi:hypothetical protein
MLENKKMKNPEPSDDISETTGGSSQHDALALLGLYLPSIYGVIIGKRKSLRTVIKKYNDRWCAVEKSVNEHGYFSAQTCIFDLLWLASEHDSNAQPFLKYIDETAKAVLKILKGDRYKEFETLLTKMITNFGERNSEYNTHFAEIAVLNKLIKDKEFTVKKIEKELDNKSKIDFEFEKDGISHLVEVYNIDFDINKISNNNEFIDFIEKRLEIKINKKLNKLEIFPDKFKILPVLWGDIIGLDKFRDAISCFKRFNFILPFMAFVQFKNSITGEIIYDFMRIDSLFERRDKVYGS